MHVTSTNFISTNFNFLFRKCLFALSFAQKSTRRQFCDFHNKEEYEMFFCQFLEYAMWKKGYYNDAFFEVFYLRVRIGGKVLNLLTVKGTPRTIVPH